MCTWNPNDLYFWRSTPLNKAEIPIKTRVIWFPGTYYTPTGFVRKAPGFNLPQPFRVCTSFLATSLRDASLQGTSKISAKLRWVPGFILWISNGRTLSVIYICILPFIRVFPLYIYTWFKLLELDPDVLLVVFSPNFWTNNRKLIFRDEIIPNWINLNPLQRDLFPNHRMFWMILQRTAVYKALFVDDVLHVDSLKLQCWFTKRYQRILYRNNIKSPHFSWQKSSKLRILVDLLWTLDTRARKNAAIARQKASMRLGKSLLPLRLRIIMAVLIILTWCNDDAGIDGSTGCDGDDDGDIGDDGDNAPWQFAKDEHFHSHWSN